MLQILRLKIKGHTAFNAAQTIAGACTVMGTARQGDSFSARF
jgi:hypothetical protein